MGSQLRKLDDLVYAAERVLVVASLAVMATVVTVDVTWRTFVGGFSGATTAILLAVTFGLCWLAASARKDAEGNAPPLPKQLGLAAGVTVALAVIVFAVVKVLPNGLPWSQKLSLCLMLWVSFVGASMATRQGRQIEVEAARKAMGETTRRYVDVVSSFGAAAFCFFIATLGYIYFAQNLADWRLDPKLASFEGGLAIPYWVVTLSVPVGMVTCGARFIGRGVSGLRGGDYGAPDTEGGH